MCTNPREFSFSDPYGNYDLKTQIFKWSAFIKGKKNIYENNLDKTYINITGGEPTLHPDFFAFLWFLRKETPHTEITLLTNGRKFSDRDFTVKFCKIAKQPFSVAIALHSNNKREFEKITGIKGSFDETIKGISNLFEFFKGEIELRLVLHRLNINSVGNIIKFIKDKFKVYKNWHLTFIHYEIEGIACRNNRRISLRLADSARIIDKNYDLLSDIKFRLYHFPLCIIEPYLRKYSMITLPMEERIYTKKCRRCRLREKCVGLMKDYYEIYGDKELKTIKK